MTEKRKYYDDSYSPVIDLPPLKPESAADEHPVTRTGHKVPRTRRRRSNTENAKAENAKNSDTSKATQVKPVTSDSTQTSLFSRIASALTSQTARWLSGIFFGGLAVYLLVAFFSYFTNCVKDQAEIINSTIGSLPKVGNAAGEGGARLSEFLINESFGLGSFVVIIWLFAISMKLLAGKPRFKTVNFTIKCLVALITVSLIIGLVTLASNTPVNWGGYHGRYVNEFIIGFIGWSGAVILCLMLVAAFFVICLRDLINWILRKRREIAQRRKIAAEARAERERREQELEEMRLREMQDAIRAGEAADNISSDNDTQDSIMQFDEDSHLQETNYSYNLDDESTTVSSISRNDYSLLDSDDTDRVNTESDSHYFAQSASYSISDEDPESDSGSSVAAPSGNMVATTEINSTQSSDSKAVFPNETARPAASEADADISNTVKAGNKDEAKAVDENSMVVNVNHVAMAKPTKPAGSLKNLYKFPSPMLLREGEQRVSIDIDEQEANKDLIRETLLYHKIPITNIEATVGPTVTLYEVRPEQGVKISRIKNLADDIAMSLSAIGVRVIAPIPGKGTVGIEVANKDPQTVSMRTIIQSRKYNETRYRLPVAMGLTIGNEVYIADLTKMPHLLVAGATGQGKSVGLNAIIASLLYKKRPDELKFVMIDPKEVEFSLYAKIEQHYLAKLEDTDAIVTDMSMVTATLNSLCMEMDNRYKLLRQAKVKNIEEYNSKYSQNLLDDTEGHRFLPYIVLVVDEFADLIMTSGKEVETPIARLAQKARAIGIHVIIATQRPSTNVITGIIKANFPVRIAFKVSSGIDSKTILDTPGAQQLIGRGDMLISNNSEMVRVQCAFIDTPEVEQICEYISRQPFGTGAYTLPDPFLNSEEGGHGGHSINDARDPLFEEVAEIVVSSGIGSTSGIQRRLSIGYNRAGKIMDQLEAYGVVGPAMGGKPRQVLMDMYSLEELLKNLN